MKTAICFSGQSRSVAYTVMNLKNLLVNRLPGCDIFIHVSDDDDYKMYGSCLQFLEPKKMLVSPDPDFNGVFYPNLQRGSLSNYLKMLNSWKQANDLMLQSAKENNIEYDCVVRTRLDIRLFEQFPAVETFDLDCITIPDFHWWSVVEGAGYNDRLAVGNSKNITYYSNLIKYIPEYSLEKHLTHAESTLRYHLERANIKIISAPIRFTRVKNGEEEDAHLRRDVKMWDLIERF